MAGLGELQGELKIDKRSACEIGKHGDNEG
jgi:hypothetical protein